MKSSPATVALVQASKVCSLFLVFTVLGLLPTAANAGVWVATSSGAELAEDYPEADDSPDKAEDTLEFTMDPCEAYPGDNGVCAEFWDGGMIIGTCCIDPADLGSSDPTVCSGGGSAGDDLIRDELAGLP